MKFVANNPPSLLILGGILGWILCGFTNIPTFCNYWNSILIVGVGLQLLWIAFKYKVFENNKER